MRPVKTTLALFVGLAFALMGATTTQARSGHAATRGRSSAQSVRPPAGRSEKVAVQPIEGTNGDVLRSLVSRIVRGRGYRAVTSLPHYDGTAQYPSLARDNNLAAFVTGDVEERGKWSSVTFLVWNGVSGSVIGRWTAAAPTSGLGLAVSKGFWQHLGKAFRKAEPPPSPVMDEAPAMRIDASNADSWRAEPIASRE
jgi:hypothetical protein